MPHSGQYTNEQCATPRQQHLIDACIWYRSFEGSCTMFRSFSFSSSAYVRVRNSRKWRRVLPCSSCDTCNCSCDATNGNLQWRRESARGSRWVCSLKTVLHTSTTHTHALACIKVIVAPCLKVSSRYMCTCMQFEYCGSKRERNKTAENVRFSLNVVPMPTSS